MSDTILLYATLDQRIGAATERLALVRARRWKPRPGAASVLEQWDKEVEHILLWAEWHDTRRRAK